MAAKVQSFSNHARVVPGYHYVTFGILLLNLVWTARRLVRAFSADAVMALLLAVALVLMFFYARMFALTVQDRVIRLEMLLRLRSLLPPDLQSRAAALTPKQLVALRFASDSELPDLCAKVLRGELQEPKAIKQAVRDWQPDHLRA